MIQLLNNSYTFAVQTQTLATKGNLVYEYNPFRNLRLSENKFEYDNQLYTESELNSQYNIYCGISLLSDKIYNYLDQEKFDYELQFGLDNQLVEKIDDQYLYNGNKYTYNELFDYFTNYIKENKQQWKWFKNGEEIENLSLYEKGTLVDFITDQLSFSLENPVSILPQYSYDGSVNLILNDGINSPKLINSRFSATGKNTYEIVDRSGTNDTNIYDEGDQFNIDTSLYKKVIKIPKVSFQGLDSGGNLKVGNYHFYFKLSDDDGNETDFIAESGLVSVFIGFGDPSSVNTGNKNENSYKTVKFFISNLDTSYSYIYVYYSRYLSELNDNFNTQYIKIDKKFPISNVGTAIININGYENEISITQQDINLNYNIIDAAKAQAVCQNMLFLGNVHKADIPYKELQDLSLHFLPYLKQEVYKVDIDKDYTIYTKNIGYYSPEFIYEKTGYWNEELYRLGVVYIMPNGELSPVFNIRGATNIYINKTNSYDNGFYSNYPVYINGERNYVSYNDSTYYINSTEGTQAENENTKGVVRIVSSEDTNIIYGFDIRIDDEAVQELKKYVKGYFFVRQSRIPMILAQGITIGIDQESHTPTIPTAGGVLDTIQSSLLNTYVETEDINGVNYISEGFLSRYSFKISKKTSGLFNKILTAVAIAVAVVAVAAACVFTAGAAGVAVGAGIAGAIAGGSSAVGAVAGTIAGTVGLSSALGTAGTLLAVAGTAGAAAGTVTAAAGAIQEVRYSLNRSFNKVTLNGRDTSIPSGYELKELDNSRKLTQDFNSRIIIKDSSKNKVQGIICPDYEINQEHFNQIFIGNKHIIGLTISQGNNGLSGRSSNYFSNSDRHFYIPKYYDMNIRNTYECKIIAVPDSTKCVGIDNLKFRSQAGDPEEAYKYEFIGNSYEEDNENKKIDTDIIRGNFGPYLAINDTSNRFSPAETVNIYTPNYSISNLDQYIQIRMDDNSSYNAISDRIDMSSIDDYRIVLKSSLVGDTAINTGYTNEVFRGDCYICQFTHRINRNFNDPSAPYNDIIVDENSWKNNFDPTNTESYQNINLGDVNAIQLGMWVTFTVRSSNNLNIRTLNGSNVDETSMTGHQRGFFPYLPMSTEGIYKTEESHIYNKGFSKSLSDRYNFQTPEVPYIKNWFGTRIMYSDIHINDAYKNGFRTFQGTHYRDYTREYGEITKLVSLESNLLCVFEHGVVLIPVNERALAGKSQGGNVYINTSNVLPENPKVISDMFGSQWADSILKTPGKTGNSIQYVYGVDTVSKKIWRTDGVSLECISDFKVQEFLNNNITLGERELTPKIGIRNVKTVYNAFKKDVLFTFYDNTYGFEEKVWNLCWNEVLNKFITFYSWVPSYMENINNIPFSFNRDTSKWISKLGTSHSNNSFADGITLSNVIINNSKDIIVDNFNVQIEYIDKSGKIVTKNYTVPENSRKNYIGVLTLSNRILPSQQIHYQIQYSLQRDQYSNYNKFTIEPLDLDGTEGGITLPDDAMFSGSFVPIYCLKLKEQYTPFDIMSEIYYRNKEGNSYSDYDTNKIKIGDTLNGKVLSIEDIQNYPIFKDITGKRLTLSNEEKINANTLVTLLNIKAEIIILDKDNEVNLSDDYYNLKAGFQSGTSLVNAGYYESVVAIIPKWNLQFLSTDFWKHGQAGLIDISDDIYPTYWYGKQHPFEFECIVVNDPSIHKIFTNLELISNKVKPESFHYEIVGDSYDFSKDKKNMYFRQEAIKALWQYNGSDISYNKDFLKIQPKQQAKSADFPHKYYTRQDTINDIEDYYIHITYPSNYNYKHLSGAEIVYYPNRQEYRIWNHSEAVDLNELDQDLSRSIISANCRYLEDKWFITINPIIICYKNEYSRKNPGPLISDKNSTWTSPNRPRLPVMNSPIPDKAYESIVDNNGTVSIPEVLTDIGYTENDMDTTSWLDDVDIYKYNFGEAQNRKEIDVKDKFLKVRIRYSGDELAVIDFLNTIYRVSYA